MQSSVKKNRNPLDSANTGPRWGLLALVLPILAWSAAAQVQVQTIGGGRLSATGPDAGFMDGSILQLSQFHTPSGAAVDAHGAVYVADRGNGAVRKLDLASDRSSTLLDGLNQPVDVEFADGNLYILTQGDGVILKLDPFGNVSFFLSGFFLPTALAGDNQGSLYLAETSGRIWKINALTGASLVLASGFNSPSGLAVLDSGLVAVSETGNHRIQFLHPSTGETLLQVGTGLAGFRNGLAGQAQFNQPQQIARAPSGDLLVADRGNHRVRLVSVTGAVTTVYGVDPSQWEGPECVTCDPMILPGWYDATADFAEARQPFGVAVSPEGKIYVTEQHYHIVREITGLEDILAGQDPGPGAGTEVAAPHVLTLSGYFPMGHLIEVVNPNTNLLVNTTLHFTTDGTIPTLQSPRVLMNGSSGKIVWRDTLRDLTSLRVRAFQGNRGSAVAQGRSASRNEVGFTRDVEAGVGSTLVLPVVANVLSNQVLRSLQFRVELTPNHPDTPALRLPLRTLPMSESDFIPVVPASTNSPSSSFAYNSGRASVLALAYVGPGSGFAFTNFAVVAMIEVRIPPDARQGDSYRLHVAALSGTSDGMQTTVPLEAMPPRDIIVGAPSYLAGDSSGIGWYQAGDFGFSFGDGLLDNRDVNNAFQAALGVRVPYLSTDLFDALDVFPPDSEGSAGGDGQIRFLDWQRVLRLSLGIDNDHWRRSRSATGQRVAVRAQPGGLPNSPAETIDTLPGAVWVREALMRVSTLENAASGATHLIPVYLDLQPGHAVSGLQFRIIVHPGPETPALNAKVRFITAEGFPAPIPVDNLPLNQTAAAWNLGAFHPPLEGKRFLGHLQISIPFMAATGDHYTVTFANADGAPDGTTQYNFETLNGSVWIRKPAPHAQDFISHEWKTHFFGDPNHPAAHPDADPDLDGIPNWKEYLAGTDPTSASSRLHLLPLEKRVVNGVEKLALRWLSAPGKRYLLEASTDLSAASWIPLAQDLPGDGHWQEWLISQPDAAPRFYRLQIQQNP
jgi:hypothetical protein